MSTGESNRHLAAALQYAGWGLAVVPMHWPVHGGCSCRNPACDKIGKHPRIKDWQNTASTDPEDIRRWWHQWPQANVGCLIPNGKAVLDVDRHSPTKDGMSALAALEAEHGALPVTTEVVTGGGGRHKWFSTNGLPVRTGDVVPDSGVELRAPGVIVMMPPSLHRSGRRYEWLPRQPIAPLPAWIPMLMSAAPPGRAPRTAPDETIPEGRRNRTLWNMAKRLRWGGHSREAILAALTAEAARCDPPYEGDLGAMADRASALTLTTYHLTDMGNGERFADEYRGGVHFCHPWRRWLIWNEVQWTRDESGEAALLAKQTVRGMHDEAAAIQEKDKHECLLKHATRSEVATRITAMLSLAESEPGIPVAPDAMDANRGC